MDLRKFERLAISEYGNVEGVKAIKGIYSSAVDVNGSGDSDGSGKELIDDLAELVEHAKENSGHDGGALMALTAIRIPEWVHLKAAHVLSQFRAGDSPRRMHGPGI
jgi:hypothetical protein